MDMINSEKGKETAQDESSARNEVFAKDTIVEATPLHAVRQRETP